MRAQSLGSRLMRAGCFLRACALACMYLLGCSAEVSPRVGALQPQLDAGLDADPSQVSFARDIRPLMNRLPNDPAGPGCKGCHYSTQPTHIGLDLGGLDLATLGSLRAGGGSSGTNIVVAGRPDDSIIIQKLRGTYAIGTRMPKSGPPFWTDAEIALLATWIAQGARGEASE